MKPKIENDEQLAYTRKHLSAAYRMFDSCIREKPEPDAAYVDSIQFTIEKFQREIIEYLDYKVDHLEKELVHLKNSSIMKNAVDVVQQERPHSV